MADDKGKKADKPKEKPKKEKITHGDFSVKLEPRSGRRIIVRV